MSAGSADPADQVGLPAAYIVLGGAGSGKSTLARHISAITGAAYLDKDAMAAPFVQFSLAALGHDPDDRESNQTYVESIMPLEYQVLFAVAETNLTLGHSVVLDAPFVAYLSDPGYLEAAIDSAGWPEVDLRVVHVRSSPEVVRERLVQRGFDRDRKKLDNWDAYWDRFGTLGCAWRAGRHDHILNDDEGAFQRVTELIRVRSSST
jgi:predicted kinase